MRRSPLQQTPDRLFDRGFRPGHPFQPRLSRLRRWGMLAVFGLLAGVIFSYGYLTDSDRVRSIAESYLTNLLGGRVTVGGANLSIFEGLRLDDVTVRVDRSDSADAVLFSAQTFLVRYDLRAMLRGRLVASQIIATDPHVRLTENLDSGQWNYQRMSPPSTPASQPSRADERLRLPEVLLRRAQVDYSEIRNGQYVSLGSLTLEAQLTPLSDGYGFRFDLQSRGASNDVGPVVSGTYDLAGGQFIARLKNFEFGRDIRTMLPAEVRAWWEQHELAGRVDIPELTYTPSKVAGGRSKFRVETELNGVTLVVKPHELMSRDEADRRYMVLRTLQFGRRAWIGAGAIDTLVNLVRPSPIRLEKVAGTLVFTEQGIDVKSVSGRVETNGLQIGGHIGGYSPDAPFDLNISSLESENLYIPASPRFVNSLPPQVREIYNRLRPQGTCSVSVQASRAASGGRPEVGGVVNVIDGQFVFDRFPYPLRGAAGKIIFGRDQTSRQEYLEIQNLRGHGVAGGPNADRDIVVNGLISPFGPTSAVTVRVEGKDITCEPILRAAFPSDVQQSLRKMFTRPNAAQEVASGKLAELPVDPLYPAFRGDFVCDVIRPLGYNQHWTINIDLDVRHADGALTAFPYPLRDVSMKLKIRDGYVEIIDAITRSGQASLKIGGRVEFGKGQPMRPNLKIEARNVPIDNDLLAAMSPQQRNWMRKIGIGGLIDIDGDVFPRDPAATQPAVGAESSSVQYDFAIALRDGTLWPMDGTFAASNMNGTLRLVPQRLTLSNVRAKRGDGEIELRGSVAWPNNRPRVALDATASNLVLDASLYALLPRAAQRGWDQVQPQGTVDANLSYSGQAIDEGEENDASQAQVGQGAGIRGAYEVVIRPRKLSVTPQAIPYRLDDLAGTVSILPDRVVLKDLSASHGPARISLAGTGSLAGGGAAGANGAGDAEGASWDLLLSARDVPVDADLRRAMPQALNTVVDGLNLRGALAFDFAKLKYRPNELAAADDNASLSSSSSSSSSPPQTRPATGQAVGAPASNADIDFVAKVWLNGAQVNVGVPLDEVVAEINLAGAARKGKLSDLTGTIDSSSFSLAQRTVSGFHADLIKPADQDALRLSNMRASLAGGEMAGQVDLAFPDQGASHYAMNLVVRDADVQQLAPQDDQNINGRLNASLSLEGDWSDLSTRRGRGDVLVTGKEMYRIPLVLGLLQITNLALPITTPFNEATASYSLGGSRVTFEGIELKSSTIMMQGDGYLDFDSKQVRLTFVTDTPNWPPLPIVGELFRSAKNELLRINVRGTIEEPKVSAASMNTLTTTVDEVFKQ